MALKVSSQIRKQPPEAVMIVSIIILSLCDIALAAVTYSYCRSPYRFDKTTTLILSGLSLVLPVIPVIMMFDVWQHTSMMGAYTRDWYKDPNSVVVPWKDSKNLKVVDPPIEGDPDDAA